MATTIRDVVVKLNIEQNQAALKPPDTGAAVVAIDEYINALKESIQVIKIDHTSAVDALKQAVVDYGTTTSAILDKLAKEWDKSKPDPGKQPLPLPNKPEVEAITSAIVDSNMKMLDSFKQAGEGAFTLARGIAFLGASSDEDLKKTLVIIAKFQGAFDIWKGGVDTIRGMVEATKVLTTAQAAQAVTQTAVGTSATTAAGGMTALNIAMGPLGIALAATAAIAGIFLYTWSKVAEETKKNTKAWEDATKALEGMRRAKDLLNTADSQNQIGELRDQTTQLQALSQQAVATKNLISSLGTDIRRARNAQGIFSNPEIQAQQAAKELAARLDLNEAIELRRQQELTTLQIQQQQSAETQRQYEKQLQTLDVLRDQSKAEEQRLRSMDAHFASLSAVEQKQLEMLSKKAADPLQKMTREELMTLQQLGGSSVSEFVNKGLGEYGQAAGSREIFGRFGVDTGDRSAALQKQIDAIGAEVGAGGGQSPEEAIAKKVEQLVAQRKESSEKVAGLLGALLEAEQTNNKRIRELEDTFRRNSQ